MSATDSTIEAIPITTPITTPTATNETPKSTQKTVTERIPGTTMLPIARVKRVIKEDRDIALVNVEATYCIAKATELFVEYLATEALSNAKKEKRKTVYYRDLANTVKEVDQFEFLEDVIPATMTLKAAIGKRKEALHDDTPLPKKQKADGAEEEDEEEEEGEGEEEEEEEEKEEETVVEENVVEETVVEEDEIMEESTPTTVN